MSKHLTKKQREELASKHSGNKSRRREGTRELFYSFLIVCEGTKTEPEYFRHFTSRRSKVITIGADRSTKKFELKYTYTKGGDQMYDILSKYGNETEAKNRAQKLREQYNDKNYAQHHPCTTVDLLVSLLEEKR